VKLTKSCGHWLVDATRPLPRDGSRGKAMASRRPKRSGYTPKSERVAQTQGNRKGIYTAPASRHLNMVMWGPYAQSSGGPT